MKPLALLALYFVLILNFNTLPAAEPPNIIAVLTDDNNNVFAVNRFLPFNQ